MYSGCRIEAFLCSASEEKQRPNTEKSLLEFKKKWLIVTDLKMQMAAI